MCENKNAHAFGRIRRVNYRTQDIRLNVLLIVWAADAGARRARWASSKRLAKTLRQEPIAALTSLFVWSVTNQGIEPMKIWLTTFFAALLLCGAVHAQEYSLAEAQAAWDRGDPGTARKHWQALADSGDIAAINNLGHLYENGIGVEKDFSKSFELYRRAAESGMPVGQFNLGEAYALGRGPKADNIEALKWYMLAANGGDADASSAAQRLQSSMPLDEQGEAALRMMQWRKEHKKQPAPVPEK
jgi:Sel1 repeat